MFCILPYNSLNIYLAFKMQALFLTFPSKMRYIGFHAPILPSVSSSGLSSSKSGKKPGKRLTPVILAIQEAEIRRIAI
jgi:hypothetical protein